MRSVNERTQPLKRLLEWFSVFKTRLYCTDGWEGYQRYLPADKHLITKRYTQSIERHNPP